jgi:hypothetical protein
MTHIVLGSLHRLVVKVILRFLLCTSIFVDITAWDFASSSVPRIQHVSNAPALSIPDRPVTISDTRISKPNLLEPQTQCGMFQSLWS